MSNFAGFCTAKQNCKYRDYRFDLPQVIQEGKIFSQSKGDIICKCCGEPGHKFYIALKQIQSSKTHQKCLASARMLANLSIKDPLLRNVNFMKIWYVIPGMLRATNKLNAKSIKELLQI